MSIYRAVFTIALLLGTIPALSQSQERAHANAAEEKPRVAIEISSDKSVYKIGESILVTITLRNEGDGVVWMSKPRGIGRFPGEFYVDVVGPDGTLLRNMSPVIGSSLKKSKDAAGDVLANFLCERVAFFPGEFWGITGRIERTFVSPRNPGRYTVTAKYLDEPVRDLSKSDLRKLQLDTRFPIQTTPIISPPLVIEIKSADAGSN